MHVTKVFTNHSFVHWKAVISEGCASVVQRQRLYGFHLWHRKGAITCACAGELQKKRYFGDLCWNGSWQMWQTMCQNIGQGKFMYKISMRVWAPRGYVVRYSGKTVFGDIMTSQCEFTLCSHPLLFWKWQLTTWQMTLDARCRRRNFFVSMILCSALRAIWTWGISKPMSQWLCLWSHVKLKT